MPLLYSMLDFTSVYGHCWGTNSNVHVTLVPITKMPMKLLTAGYTT